MTSKESIKIYLIRHGEADSSWDKDADPRLSEEGKKQSQNLVDEILKDLPSSFEIISSPLLRTRETALPLIDKLDLELKIKDTFTEIPSPGIPLSERKDWLRGIFSLKVSELEEPQMEWRNNVINSLKQLKNDTIIFSHFMVINAVVGWINDSEKFVSFYPDNCSITKIERIDGKFNLTVLGKNFPTTVQ